MKKKSGFWRAYGLYSLVLFLLCAAGLTVFWFYMSSYEKSRPENTVEEYIRVQSDDFWREGVENAIRAGGVFEKTDGTPEDYGIDLSEGFTVSYRRENPPDGNSECYVLCAGNSEICRLTLKKSGDAGFGFSIWSAAKCEFTAGNERTLRILAPATAAVTINGVIVPEEYITDRDADLGAEGEHPFDLCPAGVVYTVEGLHGPLRAEATDQGGSSELKPGQSAGGETAFIPSAPYSFRCCAPQGSVIKVNGQPLPEEYYESSEAALMSELSGYIGDNAIVFCSCDGLMTEPRVTAELDGRELEPITMEGGLVSFVPGSAALLPLQLNSSVEYFIRAYVAFSANVGDDIEKNYERLGWYLLSGTELSRRLWLTQEALIWVNSASVRYERLDIHDYIPLGDRAFLCMVDYDIVNSTGYEDRQVSASCTVLLVQSEGVWLAAGMIVDE